ncbi:M6 family metalloprotease domain-containing protein [Streptomyces sulfonofaciens]
MAEPFCGPGGPADGAVGAVHGPDGWWSGGPAEPFALGGGGGGNDAGRGGGSGGGGGDDEPRGPERRLRSTGAAITALTALAATSLVAGPAVAGRQPAPCALERTRAHHSEGLDTWNAAYPRPRRTVDALLVFLSFPDARPQTTPAELLADYFPATSRFYERASYGSFTLRPHPHRTWIRMPKPSTAYRIRRDWDAGHRTEYLRDAVAAADRHVDFGGFDLVYFVADPDAPGVDSDATKVVNFDQPFSVDGTSLRRIVTVFERHPPDRNVLAHETGHVFDLPDLYHRPSDGKGDWDTYVGDWDVMGSQFGLAPDFFGWHKWKLGWLDPRQVVCVEGGGSTRVDLAPLSAPPRRPGPALAAAAAAGSAPGADTGASTGTGGSAVAGTVGVGRGAGAGGPAGPPGPGGAEGGRAAEGARAARPARLVVVRTGRTSAIAFEARSARGNDRSTCTQGVLVYRVRSGTASGGGPVEVVDAHPATAACWGDSVYPPLADAPVRTGEHFRVPDERVRIDLEVGPRTKSGGWRVRVTTG